MRTAATSLLLWIFGAAACLAWEPDSVPLGVGFVAGFAKGAGGEVPVAGVSLRWRRAGAVLMLKSGRTERAVSAYGGPLLFLGRRKSASAAVQPLAGWTDCRRFGRKRSGPDCGVSASVFRECFGLTAGAAFRAWWIAVSFEI